MENVKIKTILFSLVILFASCSKNENFLVSETDSYDLRNNTENSINDYNDKEIFEGIFFGIGPVAESIPSIDDKYVKEFMTSLSSDDVQQINCMIDEIFHIVTSNNISEFNDFIDAMKSGDNDKISNHLISFSKIYFEELKKSEQFGNHFKQMEDDLNDIDIVEILDENGELNEEKLSDRLELNKDDWMNNEEMVTSLGCLPVICFTIIVWNYGVVVNIAAGFNLAIGVVAVVLCKLGVGDDSTLR